MTGIVPSVIVVPGFAVAQAGRNVGSEWYDAALMSNWLLGHGSQVIPAYYPNSGPAAAASKTYRFRTKLRTQAIQLVWVVTCRSTDTSLPATVTITTPAGGTPANAYASGACAYRARLVPIFHTQNLASQSNSDVEISITIAATTFGVNVESIACWEVPRASLVQDTTDYGIDPNSCAQRQPIYVPADGAGVSIGQVALNADRGRTTARRAGLLQWAVPANTTDAIAFTSTSPVDVFSLGAPVLCRKQYTADTTGTVSVKAYVACSDTTSTFRLRANTTSGGTATGIQALGAFAPASAFGWQGAPFTFAMDCEDLSVSDGRRSARYDLLSFDITRITGAGTLYLASLSAYET